MMKNFWKKYHNCFLAFVLIAGLICSSMMIPGVFAQEDVEVLSEEAGEIFADDENAVQDVSTGESADEINEDASFTNSEEQNSDDPDVDFSDEYVESVMDETAADENENTEVAFETEDVDGSEDASASDNTEVAFENLSEDTDTSAVGEAVDNPFEITNATIGDVDLKKDDAAITSWSGNATKTLQLQIDKKSNAVIDVNKKYVLSMKVSDVLYFNGLPDANAINGVNSVAIIRNAVPTVYLSDGTSQKYSKFSNYSGEILMELNTVVDTITIADMGISYDTAMVGYTGGTQTISSPIEISLFSVDKAKDLTDSVTVRNTSEKYKIVSASVTTGSLSGSPMKNTMSTKGFTDGGVNEQDVTLGKDDTIAYAGGTAGQTEQIYKSLKIVFDCPYIEVNGTKHYLKFDLNDSTLSTNSQGVKKGFKPASNAVYDENTHTITYNFKDIYLGGHVAVFYTPQFSWPDKLEKDSDTAAKEYEIQGASWKVTEQTCYTGATSSLRSEKYVPPRHAIYTSNNANITVISSDEDTSGKLAKREIYKGLTRENGHTGALGFFDIHNRGATDSPEVNVKFSFNTDSSKEARYYVTKVILPLSPKTTANVNYILTNDSQEIKGTKALVSGDTNYYVTCDADILRTNSNVGSEYYIKELSYQTILAKNTIFHVETAHLNRNRITDAGLFSGYIEGEVGSEACATLEISAANSDEKITADGKSSISSTEISTVSEDDYIAYSLPEMKINGANTQSITAGNSTTVTFGATISAEEYHNRDSIAVNGYHVFRDGIFYMCLPDGISIPGKEQVKITYNNKTIQPTDVTKLEDTACTVNGAKAHWWQITADGINAGGNAEGKNTFTVAVQLATSELMQGISWDFGNCVIVKTKDQSVSWGAAGSRNTACDTKAALHKAADNAGSKKEAIYKLANILTQENKLGLSLYNSNTNVKLDIVRAEAKLDVDTELEVADGEEHASVQITSPDTEVTYCVTVSSNDGGYAEKFSYYIPIVKTTSALDTESLVSTKEFGMCLQSGVDITGQQNAADVNDNPFTVSYTTAENVNSTTIRDNMIEWKSDSEFTDFAKVTAVRITTNENARIETGSSYEVKLSLKYDNTSKNFESMAGCQVQWRSFGRYSYKRGDAVETTNTYPSSINTITAGYKANLTGTPMKAELNTGVDKNAVDVAYDFDTKLNLFKNPQTLTIKNITVSTGTELINGRCDNLTGADANTKFQVFFNINNGMAVNLKSDKNRSWNIPAGSLGKLQAQVCFSKALTDSITERYIDVELGNDNVDIICRIQLLRTVAPVSATGSGITAGRNYQVPAVYDNACKITQKSAVTGVYVLNNFVPGNYNELSVSLKQNDTKTVIPEGASVTMMEVVENGTASSYWYYNVEKEIKDIKLTQFKRMGSNEAYKYNTATSGITYRRMFVIDFGNCDTGLDSGDYSLELAATAKEGVTESLFTKADLNFTVTANATYTLSNTSQGNVSVPEVKVTYGIVKSEGSDSFLERKSLSLVLKPAGSTKIPSDLYVSVADKEYHVNTDGYFIIPLGTIQSGEVTLKLNSNMFPDAESTFEFEGQLYLSNSTETTAPMNGTQVATSRIAFIKSERVKPSLKVSGTQVAGIDEWKNGQDFQFNIKNIPTGGSVTVTAYSGLEGTQKVTDLLSSVSGIFDISDGTGVYKQDNTPTGKLALSNAVMAGTYRLVFDVKDKDGKTVLSVPYYIVVK